MKSNIIVFLNAAWNDNSKSISGGDQMLIQIFKRIRGNFNKLFVVTNKTGRETMRRDINNADFILSGYFSNIGPIILKYVTRTLRALRIIRIRDIHILYSGSDFFPDVIPAFLYKLFHPKTKWFQCVFHIYPDWKKRPGNKVRNFVAQYLQKLSLLFIRKADQIININYQVKEELEKKGLKNISVNTPGINIEYFDKLTTATEDKIKKYEATFLARLNPSKGIFDLIEIWKRVIEKKPDAELAIMGGGNEEIKTNLRNKIKKAKLENNIDILGFMENDKAFSLIKNSSVFLFPSHEEGFGIAIAEAIACGTPVISWDLPVYKEIFEDNSIQIKENDIELFTEKVLHILNNKQAREAISQKARFFIKKYSWDSIAQKHLTILKK